MADPRWRLKYFFFNLKFHKKNKLEQNGEKNQKNP
jgi:hypothetical protein